MNPLGLTDREVLIVWAWVLGHGNDWIADWTGRSVETIKSDVKRLLRKLNARNKTHATAIVMREVLIHEVIVAASKPRPPRISLARLADGARRAVRDGVDPELALSFVIWPPKSLEVAA